MQEGQVLRSHPTLLDKPQQPRPNFRVWPLSYMRLSLLSMLTYQVDEFMEASAAPAFQGRMSELRQLVYSVLPEEEEPAAASGAKEQNGHSNGNGSASPQEEVLATLMGFKKYCFENPLVKTASAADQKTLERELRTYLLAQVQQEEDRWAIPTATTRAGKPGGRIYQHLLQLGTQHRCRQRVWPLCLGIHRMPSQLHANPWRRRQGCFPHCRREVRGSWCVPTSRYHGPYL